MSVDAWRNRDEQFVEGRELFASPRRFGLWAHTVTHGQLLIRGNPRADRTGVKHETTIDILFKPVDAANVLDVYDGLVIRCATAEEGATVRAGLPTAGPDSRVFMLESGGWTGHIVAAAVGWHEGTLPRTRLSWFNPPSRYATGWPSTPLDGVSSGLESVSAPDLVAALRSSADDPDRPLRYGRWVFVVMTRGSLGADTRGAIAAAGVFLHEPDAEEARAALAEKVAECWIEHVPIAV